MNKYSTDYLNNKIVEALDKHECELGSFYKQRLAMIRKKSIQPVTVLKPSWFFIPPMLNKRKLIIASLVCMLSVLLTLTHYRLLILDNTSINRINITNHLHNKKIVSDVNVTNNKKKSLGEKKAETIQLIDKEPLFQRGKIDLYEWLYLNYG